MSHLLGQTGESPDSDTTGQIVTLNSPTSPAQGQPSLTLITVSGSNFPTGGIPAANITLTLKPAVSGPPTGTTTANSLYPGLQPGLGWIAPLGLRGD